MTDDVAHELLQAITKHQKANAAHQRLVVALIWCGLLVFVGWNLLWLVLQQSSYWELRSMIIASQCQCHLNRIEATGGNVTITERGDKIDSLAREILQSQGKISHVRPDVPRSMQSKDGKAVRKLTPLPHCWPLIRPMCPLIRPH